MAHDEVRLCLVFMIPEGRSDILRDSRSSAVVKRKQSLDREIYLRDSVPTTEY